MNKNKRLLGVNIVTNEWCWLDIGLEDLKKEQVCKLEQFPFMINQFLEKEEALQCPWVRRAQEL